MPRSNKPFKKHKFVHNQYTKIKDRPNLNDKPENILSQSESSFTEPETSASFQKLSKSLTKDDEITNYNSSKYIIVDLDILSKALSEFVTCKSCGIGTVTLSDTAQKRKGCASNLQLICNDCCAQKSFMSSEKVDNIYDINLRFVYAMRSIGNGKSDANILCTMLDIPGPPTRFQFYNKVIMSSIEEVAEACMTEATQEVIQKTGSTDLAIAIDGTWQRRGYSSLNGVVAASSIETGKIIDVHCLSKYCHGCVLSNDDDKKTENHEKECELNYEGHSGGMEVKGAQAIFSNSLMKRGVRYLTYLGDGDSKGYSAVSQSSPYGPDVVIEKAECIGHVQKRMGARLRNICKTRRGVKLSDGKTIRGKGRLTDSEIDNIQQYYGKAIRENCKDVDQMKKAIWAIYYHKFSTNENPTHQLCPTGKTSWCGYNRFLVTGEDYKHKHSLPPAVLEEIKPIFRDLSNENLLKRCTLGLTQNPNESFNSLVWKRIPKTIHVGFVTLKLGVYDAILAFNKGALGKADVLKHLGLKISDCCLKRLQTIDSHRIAAAEGKLKEGTRERRKRIRHEKKKLEDAEEDPQYGPGMF